MVTEFRRLVFTTEELLNALEIFRAEKGAGLPPGRIRQVTIVEEPEICAHVRLTEHGSDDAQEVVVDAGMLAAVTINFCMGKKIPIPRAAKKTVVKAGEGLALSFSIKASPRS